MVCPKWMLGSAMWTQTDQSFRRAIITNMGKHLTKLTSKRYGICTRHPSRRVKKRQHLRQQPVKITKSNLSQEGLQIQGVSIMTSTCSTKSPPSQQGCIVKIWEYRLVGSWKYPLKKHISISSLTWAINVVMLYASIYDESKVNLAYLAFILLDVSRCIQREDNSSRDPYMTFKE